MGFPIELDDDTARRLQEEAARQNVDAQTLGIECRRRDLGTFDLDGRPERRPGESELNFFDRMIRELGEIAREANAPSLPDEAVTRAGIYGDHL